MTAHEIIAKAKTLPPVSQAALRLVSLLDQGGISNDEVVQTLKHDSILTAKLLRACNSARMGIAEPVYSVEQAVLLLGHQEILHIVLALAFADSMNTPPPPPASTYAEELWRHSLSAAAAAEIAADQGSGVRIEGSAAFTVGLLHDIGKMVMGQVLPPAMQKEIHHRVAEGFPVIQAEKDVCGTDHAEVGSCLLYVWRLPAEIVEAVANHHTPVLKPVPRPSAIACLASEVAHLVALPAGAPAEPSALCRQIAGALRLTPDQLENVITLSRDSCDWVEQMVALQ